MNRRVGRSGRWVALALALSIPPALPARADSAPRPAPGAPRREARGRAAPSGLDRRVALLARALRLDAWQQAALRRVLTEEHAQERRIWSDASLPSANRVAATTALRRHTADRIRALLDAEQRDRYDPPPTEGPAQAIADARVEDWLTRQRGDDARTAGAAGAVRGAR